MVFSILKEGALTVDRVLFDDDVLGSTSGSNRLRLGSTKESVLGLSETFSSAGKGRTSANIDERRLMGIAGGGEALRRYCNLPTISILAKGRFWEVVSRWMARRTAKGREGD